MEGYLPRHRRAEYAPSLRDYQPGRDEYLPTGSRYSASDTLTYHAHGKHRASC
ncbi:MAG: hypothetical protein HY520_03805 [Candidatus Aenigmarchaeota archaeon]|nr:hypothetical protein [Candidatus Aenigmarchaeota archaeon]